MESDHCIIEWSLYHWVITTIPFKRDHYHLIYPISLSHLPKIIISFISVITLFTRIIITSFMTDHHDLLHKTGHYHLNHESDHHYVIESDHYHLTQGRSSSSHSKKWSSPSLSREFIILSFTREIITTPLRNLTTTLLVAVITTF